MLKAHHRADIDPREAIEDGRIARPRPQRPRARLHTQARGGLRAVATSDGYQAVLSVAGDVQVVGYDPALAEPTNHWPDAWTFFPDARGEDRERGLGLPNRTPSPKPAADRTPSPKPAAVDVPSGCDQPSETGDLQAIPPMASDVLHGTDAGSGRLVWTV